MPDPLRRVAVLTVASSFGIALLVPVTARSAEPEMVEAHRLLDAGNGATATLPRGLLVGRETTAGLILSDLGGAAAPESLALPVPLPTPATAPMEATLYVIRIAPPPPAPAALAEIEASPPPTSGPPPEPPTAPPSPPPSTPADAISGTATWYCCTLGYRGQAVLALPGALGGRYQAPPATNFATVCADRCASLPVVDYCSCYWGTADQRVADLSPEAWAAVSDAPLSRGVITVTVTPGG